MCKKHFDLREKPSKKGNRWEREKHCGTLLKVSDVARRTSTWETGWRLARREKKGLAEHVPSIRPIKLCVCVLFFSPFSSTWGCMKGKDKDENGCEGEPVDTIIGYKIESSDQFTREATNSRIQQPHNHPRVSVATWLHKKFGFF